MRSLILALAGLVIFSAAANADLVFSENIGVPSGTTAIASYTGWQNNGTLTFTGSGDVRVTTPSAGYTGASGSGNVFLTNSGTANFQIASISTLAFDPVFTLAFGAYKSTTASNMSELKLEYSSNGTDFTTISIPAQPTGSGTANWRLITLSNLTLPVVTNLRLRWTNTSTTPQFRIDDVTLSGTLSAVPEPAAVLFGGLVCSLLGLTVAGRRALAWLHGKNANTAAA